ncbi:hypothetical protein FB451DRAFT_1439283 [Mycena latifolia]|nr:hypothetical protein FB451DRAFT_1439283 [Mycena latifolia]
MGGTLWACGPGQTPRDVSQTDDGVSMYYRYSGFTDFKGIILNATIAFLTALSGKQISKKLLIDEGVVTKEAVEDLDEAIVIANYRSRIDAAISLLKSWLNTKSGSPPEDPILKMFGGSGSRLNINPMSNLGRFLDQRAFIAEIMAEVPIDFNVVNPKNLDPEKLTPPHTLTELRLAGIHAFILFPDNDGTLSYEQAKEVERLLRMVRPYCVWDEKWGAPPPPEYQPPRVRASAPAAESDALSSDEKDGGSGESAQVKEDGRDDVMEDEDEDDEMDREDEQHFIDEMITVFAAVPPGVLTLLQFELSSIAMGTTPKCSNEYNGPLKHLRSIGVCFQCANSIYLPDSRNRLFDSGLDRSCFFESPANNAPLGINDVRAGGSSVAQGIKKECTKFNTSNTVLNECTTDPVKGGPHPQLIMISAAQGYTVDVARSIRARVNVS